MKRVPSATAFRTIRTEGGLLPSDLLQRVASEDKSLPGLSASSYHLEGNDRIRDAVNRAWTRLTSAWRSFQAALAKLPDTHSATAETRDKWLLPLFDTLGYGRLPRASTQELDGKSYPISHAWHHCPIHLLGSRVELDVRQKGVPGAAAVSPHGLVQDFLNRSDKHLWGFLSNGLLLRVLRDHHSLTQQAYVQFDLEAMMEGGEFSDFRVLWLLCHQSRMEAEKPDDCHLERWFQTAREEGVRALDDLQRGVEKAIEHLGSGFLRKKSNERLHAALADGTLDKQEYYRELLRLVYRLIFVFVAEDRDALLLPVKDPDPPELAIARDRYRRFYSTRRVRDLADKRRGGPHGDLWQSLRLVLHHLHDGSPALALPALGSFLFRPSVTPHLNDAELGNEDLLNALRELCFVQRGKIRHVVNFRNVGAEELGSVYESLLERHPDIHREAAVFKLNTAPGHERKTTGSYYTPRALVDCLLDSALDPVLDEAAGKQGPEKAILDLKVCDPACGSGHFLVAAARRIAMRLASVRAGGDEPSPPEVQRALRDVVGRCIYGVDLNPMAVELCKVSLWMEAVEPGRPLSFLEGHIREGNALLGTTPALMERGIPEEAFEAIEGDDKDVAKRLKKRNREARKGQMNIFADLARAGGPVSYGRLSTGAAAVEAATDESLQAIRKKEDDWDRFTGSEEYRAASFLADAWCAAFVWPKQPGPLEDGAITHDLWLRMREDPKIVSKAARTAVRDLAREYSFFHWHLAFPQVFTVDKAKCKDEKEVLGWTGGFDLMLGNPPWDTMSPDAKEFFSQYDPSIRTSDKDGQAKIIEPLLLVRSIAEAWERTRRHLFCAAHFFRESGRYVLFAPGNLGKGDFNIFRMFVEAAIQNARDGGFAAQVVPDSLYSGANSMALRKALFEDCELRLLLALENAAGVWFPGVHRSQKFCVYAARKGGCTKAFKASFGIQTLNDLAEVVGPAGGLLIPVNVVREFSDETLAVMEFREQRDIDIARKMYERWPPLGDVIPGAPHRDFLRELESGHVQQYLTTDPKNLPHYEGRMIDQYDHRAKGYRSGRARAAVWEELAFESPDKTIQPQWYVPRSAVPARAKERIGNYRVAFCDVASPTNERSLVAAVIPPGCIAGDKVPTVVMQSTHPSADLLQWLAAANSFSMDFLVRMKVSLKMSLTILDSLPFPRLPVEDERAKRLVTAALKLVCTGPEMNNLWNLVSAEHSSVAPIAETAPVPGVLDSEERQALVAAIEAEVATMYSLTREELGYIMDTFPIVQKRDIQKYGTYRTKDVVLAAYDRLVSPPENQS